jgi:hypothetical protein
MWSVYDQIKIDRLPDPVISLQFRMPSRINIRVNKARDLRIDASQGDVYADAYVDVKFSTWEVA